MKRNIEIRHDIRGKKIVVINDILFRGKRCVCWDDVEIYLKVYIGDLYTISNTNEVIYIGKDLPDEYTGSKYTRSLKGGYAKAKANAVQGIPELIQTAVNKRYKENLQSKHQMNAKYGWYRYDSMFAIPVFDEKGEINRYNIFSAELLIRHDADGKMYLYDLVNIKKRNEQPAWPNAYGKEPIS